MRTVSASLMTPETFAPFGRILMRPKRDPDIQNDALGYWHALDPIGFERQPVWGYLEVYARPRVFDRLERHCDAHEVFIPVSGAAYMPFARGGDPDDPDATPDLDTLTVFRVESPVSFVIGRGIWHAVGFPLERSAAYLLALEAHTPSDDLDVRTIGSVTIQT